MDESNNLINDQYVKLGVFDIDGILRGKYTLKDKIKSHIDFCSVILGWDIHDQLYNNCKFTGWHTGYNDTKIRVVPESKKNLPDEKIDFYICDFVDKASAICPRTVLKKIISKAEDMNIIALAGFEYEFFLFDETPYSIRDKKYHNLKTLTPGNCGYSVLRSNQYYDFYHSLLNYLAQVNIPIEGIHTETGPGVIEAAIKYSDALTAADNAGLFKTFTKTIAHKNNYLACFMARWANNVPGQSGHIHVSLQNKNGDPLFHDNKSDNNISRTMKNFIAGQQRLMPELLALIAPTINSYTRLVPGFWAPTHATIGIDNRTCAIRIIPGHEKSQRVEYRVTGAEVNPYLALAVALGSGLYGIEQQLEPIDIIHGNAYDPNNINHDLEPFSRNLSDAVNKLEKSQIARELLGTDFVDHFCLSRKWEVEQYNKSVNTWQLERYFELI